ncbi:hypothetical protein ACROYT_G008935 [Oculina patagonica]
MKLALFLILCLAFAFVVESFEEEAVLEGEQGKESFEDEAVLEGEQGKQSFEDEAVLADGRGKESFEDEAVNVFADEQGKQSFEDEAVLEGEQGNESFDDEVVLEDERGKESFKHGAVFADELGKESFEDEAVLEGEQGNDKRRLGQRMSNVDPEGPEVISTIEAATGGVRIRQPNVTIDQSAVTNKRILILKASRSAAKGVVTRKQNEAREIMSDFGDVNDLERKSIELDEAIDKFKTAHQAYHDKLDDQNEIDD